MSWAAVAGAAVGVVGGAIAGNQAKSAGNQQANAALAATDEQRRQFDQTNALLAPYRGIGLGALNRLDAESNGFNNAAYLRDNPDVAAQGMQGWDHYQQYGRNEGRAFTGGTNFTADPGYDWTRTEGQRGIQQSAAARGTLKSGNALKALTEYNQNLASQQYGNWWNRQSNLAGIGQTATNNLVNAGQQTAGNIGNALMAGGDARASGIMGQANSWAGGLNSGVNNYLYLRGRQNSGGLDYVGSLQSSPNWKASF